VRLLLDTHAFLWFCADDSALSSEAKSRIQDPRNDKFLSVASIWEIAIKRSLGKLHLSVELSELVAQATIPNGIGVLDVRTEHAVGVVSLPFFHRDPFDRMLVAQALAERLAIVGGDAAFDAYPIRRIW
jgi:PIN domain nuclease of toxin-antitoxin system